MRARTHVCIYAHTNSKTRRTLLLEAQENSRRRCDVDHKYCQEINGAVSRDLMMSPSRRRGHTKAYFWRLRILTMAGCEKFVLHVDWLVGSSVLFVCVLE